MDYSRYAGDDRLRDRADLSTDCAWTLVTPSARYQWIGTEKAAHPEEAVIDGDGLLLLPVHLIVQVHGVYRSWAWSTLRRMLMLGLATAAAFIVLLTSLTVLASQPLTKS